MDIMSSSSVPRRGFRLRSDTPWRPLPNLEQLVDFVRFAQASTQQLTCISFAYPLLFSNLRESDFSDVSCVGVGHICGGYLQRLSYGLRIDPHHV